MDRWTQDDEVEWQSLLSTERMPHSRSVNPTNENTGEQNMINLQRRQVPTGNESTPRSISFLSPRHVTFDGVLAKVIKVTTDKPDNFGNPVVVFYEFGGQKYQKGYKMTSDNLASQVDILGTDESKWIGKSLLISKVEGEEGDERLHFAAPKSGKGK